MGPSGESLRHRSREAQRQGAVRVLDSLEDTAIHPREARGPQVGGGVHEKTLCEGAVVDLFEHLSVHSGHGGQSHREDKK